MKLRQLEAMRALMVKGTTIQAAEALGLTQSAVSRLISQLEEELGLELFYRRQGRLVVTPEGKQFFEVARRILTDIDRLTAVARDIRALRHGAVRMITMPAYGYRLVPETIRRLRSRFKQVKIALDIGGRYEIEEAIKKDGCDFAVATLPIDASGGEIEYLGTLDAVCTMPPDSPLAAQPVIAPEDLERQPFISVEPQSMLRLSTDELFGKRGVKRNLSIEAQSATVACSFVANGLGVSLIHPFIAEQFRGQVAIRPFSPPVRLEFGLVFPADRRQSLFATEFIAVLKDEVARLTEGVTAGRAGA